MEGSVQNNLQTMNLHELREFAEERGISTRVASRLWYALAREALSQSLATPDTQALTYDENLEIIHFSRNPQEFAGDLRNVGRVSLQLLSEFTEEYLER